MRNKILLTISEVAESTIDAFVVLLEDKLTRKCIPIVIGRLESQSIIHSINNMVITRPLTHDLFHNFANQFNIKLKEVIIDRFDTGIFSSTLIWQDADGNCTELDSRTSDAIALAMRFKCPIYTIESVMSETGIDFDDLDIDFENDTDELEDDNTTPTSDKEKIKKNIAQLETQLEEAVEREDYQEASKLRDLIKQLKQNN